MKKSSAISGVVWMEKKIGKRGWIAVCGGLRILKMDNNFGVVTSNQNPAFKTLNTTPGAPAFADFHDAMNFSTGVNQATIAPYYAMSQCAAAPTLCAMFPDTFIKVGTWGQVNTNLDIYKNDHKQNQ